MTAYQMNASRNEGKIKKSSEVLRILKQLSYNKLAMFGLILFVVELDGYPEHESGSLCSPLVWYR